MNNVVVINTSFLRLIDLFDIYPSLQGKNKPWADLINKYNILNQRNINKK